VNEGREGSPGLAGPQAGRGQVVEGAIVGAGGRQRPGGPGSRAFGGLSMSAFVVLGLPDGMIGTAWPTLRRGFGAPLGDLGIFLLVGTIGGLASSSVAGLLLGRFGTRLTIMGGGLAGALGAAGILASTGFWPFALSGILIGVAAGLLDSAVNTSIALAGRNRLLNMVHGCYGVGTALGPLVVTGAVLAGSWRAGYGVVIVAELALVAGWAIAGRRLPPWVAGPRAARASPSPASPSPASPSPALGPAGGPEAAVTGRRDARWRVVLVVGLGLVVFMVYVGFEAGAGQWGPSFDRGPLHMSAAATGLAAFGYWGALTAVRFALAVPRRPVSPVPVVRWGCAVALAGALLVWWRPDVTATVLGLVVIGGALAGVFPALVALTPGRVGDARARHVIGWQIGAAGLGGSVISAAFGAVFQRYGLDLFGPALVVVGCVLALGALALEHAQLGAGPRPLAGPGRGPALAGRASL